MWQFHKCQIFCEPLSTWRKSILTTVKLGGCVYVSVNTRFLLCLQTLPGTHFFVQESFDKDRIFLKPSPLHKICLLTSFFSILTPRCFLQTLLFLLTSGLVKLISKIIGKKLKEIWPELLSTGWSKETHLSMHFKQAVSLHNQPTQPNKSIDRLINQSPIHPINYS